MRKTTRLALVAALLFSPCRLTAMNIGEPIDRNLLPLHYRISSTYYDHATGRSAPTPAGIQSEIRAAADAWQAVGQTRLQMVFDGMYQPAEFSPVPPGMVLVDLTPGNMPITPGAPAGNGEQVRDPKDPGRVIGGVLRLNTQRFDFAADKNGFLYRVVLHELGHVLGLKHTPVSGTTMSYRPEPYQMFLSLDDIEAIRQLYPDSEEEHPSITVTTSLDGKPAKEAEIVLIDVASGIGRFQLTNAEGLTAFYGIPTGSYILAAREVTPVGPCFSKDAARGFLATFYDGGVGTNSPAKAASIAILPESRVELTLPLRIAEKRFDCYYGIKGAGVRKVQKGYHLAQVVTHYLAERGEEFKLQLYKDQNPAIPEPHRTRTSGGVATGTSIVAAGDDPGFMIAPAETPESPAEADAIVRIDADAAEGPRVVYCVNDGEVAITSVAFHIVDALRPKPFAALRK